MVVGPLLGRHLRYRKDSRRNEAQIYPNRHPARSLQRPLPRMDRDLLDANEGNIRGRNDKPTDQRQSQNRPGTAHTDGTLPSINIQASIAWAGSNSPRPPRDTRPPSGVRAASPLAPLGLPPPPPRLPPPQHLSPKLDSITILLYSILLMEDMLSLSLSAL